MNGARFGNEFGGVPLGVWPTIEAGGNGGQVPANGAKYCGRPAAEASGIAEVVEIGVVLAADKEAIGVLLGSVVFGFSFSP